MSWGNSSRTNYGNYIIAEKGESNINNDSKGNKVSQVIPAGLSLMVKQGDTVKN
jgi:hypothetical protein